ncbi:MAG TPA: hypothetical protein VGK77_00055, partial [Candidatus Binatia bacterium]
MKHFARVSREGISIFSLVALLLTSLAFASAQQPSTAKRPLAHRDYDSWRTIGSPQISRDGKFVAYPYMSQDGDSEVVARNLASGVEWRAPRGYRPPAPPPDDSLPNFGEIIAAQGRLVRPLFTADSRFLVFSIEPGKAELNKAKKEKKKPEDMPKNALGIMDLSNGQVARIDRVKNFQVPEDGSGFIAYLLEPKPEAKGAGPAASEGGNPTVREGAKSEPPASASTSPTVREGSKESSSQTSAKSTPQKPASRDKKKEYGSDLVLRNTATGTERTFNDVLDFTLSKDARTLAFTVSSKKEETNGVYVVTPQTDAAPVSLLAGKGKYQKLTWDEEQTELAFISDRDDSEA